MSTKASIQLKHHEDIIHLYRHSGGYPEYCGVELAQFLTSYEDYWDCERMATELVRLEQQDFEVAKCEHADCDFKYVIDCVLHSVQVFAKRYLCFEVCGKEFEWVDMTHHPNLPKELFAMKPVFV
ncbi:MAG: hypothetical protein IJV56_01330 [Neisseriaceae bacterium]|nr:hypothetical protein [Neisseriaceae bacterium]